MKMSDRSVKFYLQPYSNMIIFQEKEKQFGLPSTIIFI